MSSRQSPSATPVSPTASLQPHRYSTSPTKSPTATSTAAAGFLLLSPVSANSQIIGSQHQHQQYGGQGKTPSPRRRSPGGVVFRGSTSPSRLLLSTPPSRVVSQSRAEEADDSEPQPTAVLNNTSSSAPPPPQPTGNTTTDAIDASNNQALMLLMQLDNQRILQQTAESDDLLVRRSCTVAPSQSHVVLPHVAAESASPSDFHHRGSIQIGRASSLLAHRDDDNNTTTNSQCDNNIRDTAQHRNPSMEQITVGCVNDDDDASPLRSQQSFQAEVSEDHDDSDYDSRSSSSIVDCIKDNCHLYNNNSNQGVNNGGGGADDDLSNIGTRPNEFDTIDTSLEGARIIQAATDLMYTDDCVCDIAPHDFGQPVEENDTLMEDMPDYNNY